jgi:hypothetical protein
MMDRLLRSDDFFVEIEGFELSELLAKSAYLDLSNHTVCIEFYETGRLDILSFILRDWCQPKDVIIWLGDWDRGIRLKECSLVSISPLSFGNLNFDDDEEGTSYIVNISVSAKFSEFELVEETITQ